MKATSHSRGMIIPQALVYATVGILIISALINWGANNLIIARKLSHSEQAFQIAEAGVEYYRWHLAHASTDYRDGTATSGPYVHTFYDKDGVALGTYSLDIVPPPTGSTIVTITSTGKVLANPTIQRKIQTKLAIPSLATFAIVGNDDMRFGAGTEIFGPVHSNGGIRFDGLGHNIISSARTSYTDPDAPGGTRFGVHTTLSPTDPQPPSATPSRPDVFMAGRQFPVPAVDFTGLTSDLSSMKSLAQSGGKYLASSGNQGYHIVLKTNDTYDLYRVTNLQAAPNNCTNTASQTGWGTWSIRSSPAGQTLIGNYANPGNGIIFAEDNIWVDGQISSARLTIVAAKFPDTGTRPSITVNSDLLYTNYDGQDVVALISQGDFHVGLFSDDNLRIDGAIIAQNGRAGRYYYESDCGTNQTRDTLTLNGMIASNDRYGFAYTDGTGYQNRVIVYDGNLLYGPPPSFPLTSSQYSTISWQEIR